MGSLVFYIVLFLLVFALNYFSTKVHTKHKKISIFLKITGLALLIILMWIRYDVGTDWKQYYLEFENSKNIEKWEVLNIPIYTIAKALNNPYLIFLLYGLLSIIPIYIANAQFDDKYLPLSILLFCCLVLPFDMNGMRQGVAISFAILSIIYAYKQKRLWSILSILIAFMFHRTSIILSPYIIIWNLKNNKKINLYISTATIIIIVLLLFFNNMPFMQNYNYITNTIGTKDISFIPFITAAPILTLSAYYLIHTKENIDNKTDKSHALFLIIGYILTVLCTTATNLSRIGLYFTACSVIFIPKMIEQTKRKKLLTIAFAIYIIIYFILSIYVQGRNGIIPYQSWIF